MTYIKNDVSDELFIDMIDKAINYVYKLDKIGSIYKHKEKFDPYVSYFVQIENRIEAKFLPLKMSWFNGDKTINEIYSKLGQLIAEEYDMLACFIVGFNKEGDKLKLKGYTINNKVVATQAFLRRNLSFQDYKILNYDDCQNQHYFNDLKHTIDNYIQTKTVQP